MRKDTMKAAAVVAAIMIFENWFDPIEDDVRARVRGFIQTMLDEELNEAFSRPRQGGARRATMIRRRRWSPAGMATASAR